ncbi:unnamed protein product [Phytophthora fragariaefolia]|uniref:Unnamed protein product n=1 Tax=Phytophthora fragariaefolia TaxID=1490495 RepID=A0A9W6TQX4_9STRA|nr:unnamed protein product [Phytophthora fragariaefolia]
MTARNSLNSRSGDGARPQADHSSVYKPFEREPKRFKKDDTPYKPRKGWGPYRSVPNERAAAFNLQLDVQALQQEIRDLTALRDILRTKTMVQRHSLEGSLVQIVNKCFTVFREEPASNASGEALQMSTEQQYDFLYSMVDADVDVGNGLRSPKVIMHQLDMYSTLLRWIHLEMQSFDIVECEDSMIIKTRTTLRCQIIDKTIEKLFPHLLGEELVVSKLVGKVMMLSIGVTFYFNAEEKCFRLDVDADLVETFSSIVKELRIVDLLFGSAVISGNLMLDDAESRKEDKKTSSSDSGETNLNTRRAMELQYIDDYRHSDDTNVSVTGGDEKGVSVVPVDFLPDCSSQSTTCLVFEDVDTMCLRAVNDYYLAFANGFLIGDDMDLAAVFQHDFLLHRFADRVSGNQTIATKTAVRWHMLSHCFSVVSFHKQTNIPATVRHYVACVLLALELHTIYTLSVPSQLYFAIEIATARIYRIEERMDFEFAVPKIVANAQELEFVMSRANLAVLEAFLL